MPLPYDLDPNAETLYGKTYTAPTARQVGQGMGQTANALGLFGQGIGRVYDRMQSSAGNALSDMGSGYNQVRPTLSNTTPPVPNPQANPGSSLPSPMPWDQSFVRRSSYGQAPPTLLPNASPNTANLPPSPTGTPVGNGYYAQPSQQIGTRMPNYNPLYSPTGQVTVGGNVDMNPYPVYQTNYTNAQGNNVATVTGPDQRVGGGTVSTLGPGTGTAEGNTAAYMRQIATLQAINGMGQNSLPSPPTASTNPFSLPSDRYGDAEMRAANYDYAVRHGRMKEAQGLLAPGMASIQQQGTNNNQWTTLAQSQIAHQAALQAAQAQAGQQGFQNQLDAAKFGLDQQKTANTFEMNAVNKYLSQGKADQIAMQNSLLAWLKDEKNLNHPQYNQLRGLYEITQRLKDPMAMLMQGQTTGQAQ